MQYHVLYKLVQILAEIELPCEAQIGQRMVIDHFGGIIVSGYAQIREDCRLRDGVVIGPCRIEEKCAPIGENVDIDTGTKLLGPITIGNNVRIGANAVVLCDVPDYRIAVGVPAVLKHSMRSEIVLSMDG